MHTMVQINCAELIYFLLVMKWCYFKIVYSFYIVYIQCIIQPDGEYPTDKNWSTGLAEFKVSFLLWLGVCLTTTARGGGGVVLYAMSAYM